MTIGCIVQDVVQDVVQDGVGQTISSQILEEGRPWVTVTGVRLISHLMSVLNAATLCGACLSTQFALLKLRCASVHIRCQKGVRLGKGSKAKRC